MNRIAVLALLLIGVAPPATAQLANFQEGEGVLGLAGQNDASLFNGVKLSPVGLAFGVIAQPLFSNRRLSILEQVTLFPVIEVQRFAPTAPSTLTRSNTKPLIVSTTLFRWTSQSPEEPGEIAWFVGGGGAFSLTTPRSGGKVAPVASLGIRRWRRGKEMGFEAAIQCGFGELGRTNCLLPVTSLWPFR